MMQIIYLWSLPYVRWHIIFTFIPSLFLWLVWGNYLIKYKKTLIFITLGSFLWGLPLDILATPIFHIYYFNPSHNLGIQFLGLPLEEYLFLLFIPQEVACIGLLIRRKLGE